MATPQGRMQFAPSGPQTQQGLHPTVTYGQPGGQQATVIPPGQPMPRQGQQSQPQSYAPVNEYPSNGYHPSLLPPSPQQMEQAARQYLQNQGFQQPNYPQQQQQQGAQYQQPQQQGQPYQQAPQQQPQFQPYQQQGQQQGQQRIQYDPNAVLDGEGVPPELRGRKLGQVMQMYGVLSQDYAQRLAQRTGGYQIPQQQAPQPQQQGQQQSTYQPYQPQQQPRQGQQPQQGQQQQGWQAEVSRVVRETMAPMLQPVLQNTAASSIKNARDQVAGRIQDFADLEPHILQHIQQSPGVTPEALGSEQFWEAAADLVRGRLTRTGQYQPQQQGGQQQNGQQIFQDGAGRPMVRTQFGFAYLPQNGQQQFAQQQIPTQQYGPSAVPANQAPIPQYQFFSEGPTAPTMNQGQGLLTPLERSYADKMGMSPEEYVAWRGGVVR